MSDPKNPRETNLANTKLHGAFLDAMTLIETDARSRVVLPGHPGQMFVMQENSDGSILLLPAKITTEAQLEYDQTPELRNLLARASASGTVRKRRHRAE